METKSVNIQVTLPLLSLDITEGQESLVMSTVLDYITSLTRVATMSGVKVDVLAQLDLTTLKIQIGSTDAL